MKSSGATNRGRARAADAERNAEADAETLRLANLTPEEAAQLRQVFDWLEWGLFREQAEEDDAPPAAVGPPDA